MSAGERFLDRMLRHHTGELGNQIDTCLAAFLGPSNEPRSQSASTALECSNRLLSFLSPEDRPEWLKELSRNLQLAYENHSTAASVGPMRRVMELRPEIDRHDWKVSTTPILFDFDEIFEACRDECMVPELFDEVISWLQQIVDSGEVDDDRILRSIESMIASLRRARNGSYVATVNGWPFLKAWAKNSMWEFLASIPAISPLVKGFRKTLTDGDGRIEQMKLLTITKAEEATDRSIQKNAVHIYRLPAPSSPAFIDQNQLPSQQ